MQHRKRPVRVLPNVYGELQTIPGGYCRKVSPRRDESEREARREVVERLSTLSTKQLMHVARKEGANVPLRYGNGMRRRFIAAIADKRMEVWRERRKADANQTKPDEF